MERWTRSRGSARLAAAALCALTALAPVRGLCADAAETKARALFKQGQQAYDLGEFDKALELYGEAYKQKALPGFLFNIAQCHRQKGNWEQAAFFFGRFIDNMSPNAPNVEVARELLEDARRKQAQAAEEARLAEEKKKAEEDRLAQEELARRKAAEELRELEERRRIRESMPPPPPVVVVEQEPVTKKPWFWVLVVGGVLAVAGGTTAAVLVATRPQPQPAVPSQTTLGEIEVK